MDEIYFQFHLADEDVPKIISYDAWVCNGNIPAQFIRPQTKFLLKERGYSLSLSNLEKPTKISKLFGEKKNSSSLITNLGINFSTLIDIENLKKILSQYVPDDSQGINHQRYIDSLKKINLMNRDIFEKGIMKSQWNLYISIDLDDFVNIGEAVLWCKILSQFFVNYAPVNKMFSVIIESVDGAESWCFSYRTGLENIL